MAVTHPPAHVPWTIYNNVENTVCEEWASNPKLHLLPFRIAKSALHRQAENWYIFSFWCWKKTLRTSEERARKFPSFMLAALKWSCGRNNPLHRCHKDDKANGHTGSSAKGTTLYNGSKRISALAPWNILFLRPGSTLLTPCDSRCLQFSPTWALPSSHRAPSCLPLPHPQPSLTHSHVPLHTHWAFCTQNEISQQKLQSFRGVFTERVMDRSWHQPCSSPSFPALP